MTSTLQIGTATLAALAAGVMLYVAGTISVERVINFTPVSGTETGATIQLNGVVQQKINTTALTNTGGVAAYDVASITNPFNATGAITNLSIECGNVPKPWTLDVGFSTAVKTATSSTLAAFDNVVTGTGFFARYGSGGILWQANKRLKVGSLTSVPTTSGNDCYLRYNAYQVHAR